MHSPITLIFFFAILSVAHAQRSEEDSIVVGRTEFAPPPDSVFVVDSIVVVGNEKTKAYVLLREMTLKNGDYITAEAMEYDKKRIYSLGLFTRVEMGYAPTHPPKAALVIVVDERWYIFPYPLVGIKDRDWKKFYFGGGITHQNFRGKNEKLYAALILGYDPAVFLSYRNPLIDAENNYFFNAGFTWQVIRNRSVLILAGGNNFDERHFNISVDFGKRIGIAHTMWFSTAYEVVKVSEYFPGRTLSSSGTDAFPLFGIGYMYDTRDLKEYAMSGTFVRVAITKFGVPWTDVNFVRYAFDYRRFIPMTSRLTLAGRFFGDFPAAGQIPTYSRTYFGYTERIRGHFFEIYEGEQRLGASMELRLMLLGTRYFAVDFIPIPEFSVWKFGIAAALFGDAGAEWFRGQSLALNRFIRGYGAGIHILLPYGFVFRTEYAFNELRRGELLLDITASF